MPQVIKASPTEAAPASEKPQVSETKVHLVEPRSTLSNCHSFTMPACSSMFLEIPSANYKLYVGDMNGQLDHCVTRTTENGVIVLINNESLTGRKIYIVWQ